MPDGIIPFGKYRGQPIEAIAEDRSYVDWLLAQPWFRERYAGLHSVVINNFCEPSDTPEHNSMQARFLDEQFRMRFGAVALQGKIKTSIQCLIPSVKALAEYIDRCSVPQVIDKSEFSASKFRYLRYRDGSVRMIQTWQERQLRIRLMRDAAEWSEWSDQKLFFSFPCGQIFKTSDLAFEQGYDVSFSCSSIGIASHREPNSGETKIGSVGNVGSHESQLERLRIEIKPVIGDDYPGILRQVKRSSANYILTKEYNGIGASLEQVVEIFKLSGVQIVFESDVDGCKAAFDSFDPMDFIKQMEIQEIEK